mgnify:CR=1 FL=1
MNTCFSWLEKHVNKAVNKNFLVQTHHFKHRLQTESSISLPGDRDLKDWLVMTTGSSWEKPVCIISSIDNKAVSFLSNKSNSLDPIPDVCNDLSDTTKGIVK